MKYTITQNDPEKKWKHRFFVHYNFKTITTEDSHNIRLGNKIPDGEILLDEPGRFKNVRHYIIRVTKKIPQNSKVFYNRKDALKFSKSL
jgi:hypothetical protein